MDANVSEEQSASIIRVELGRVGYEQELFWSTGGKEEAESYLGE
jgi:hypothetical protein